MEKLEMLSKDLKRSFLALAIMQLVALFILLMISLTYTDLVDFPGLIVGMILGGGLALISFLNRKKVDRKEELSVFPYYIFLVVKALDAVWDLMTRNSVVVSLVLVFWMIFLTQWIKSYNQELAQLKNRVLESEDSLF